MLVLLYFAYGFTMLQGGFLPTWRVHGFALHGDRCTAGREAHANFADESACLMADNIRNAVVTIHRSQDVVKMPSPLHVDISFAINRFIKNRHNIPSCTYSTPDTNFHWMASAIVLPF
jgi:hypothetical protein